MKKNHNDLPLHRLRRKLDDDSFELVIEAIQFELWKQKKKSANKIEEVIRELNEYRKDPDYVQGLRDAVNIYNYGDKQ